MPALSELLLRRRNGFPPGRTHEIAGCPRLGNEFPLPAGEGQGEGDGGLQLSATWRFAWRGALCSFSQNGRLHLQSAGALICRAFLPPHPSPLPEERENRTIHCRPSGAPRLVAARDAVFPAGEREGCPGNTRSPSSNVFEAFPSPALRRFVPRGEMEKRTRRLLPRLRCPLCGAPVTALPRRVICR